MKHDNAFMLALTANMPCKQINIERRLDPQPPTYERGKIIKPYLQRYYAAKLIDNCDLWIHRFLCGDPEEHLHNHGFEFWTIPLSGGYKYSYIDGNNHHAIRETNQNKIDLLGDTLSFLAKDHFHKISSSDLIIKAQSAHFVDLFTWHRIVSVQPETWTAVLVPRKRRPEWHFKDAKGNIVANRSSNIDWWKNYHPRGQNIGDVCT